MYRKAKHMVSRLVNTSNRLFSTEKLAQASIYYELHQVVNSLANRHPPNLPTIYPSSDLPNLFIRHNTNTVEKRRANIALDPVSQHLLIGQLLQPNHHFKKCHNQQRKNTFLIPLVCHVN